MTTIYTAMVGMGRAIRAHGPEGMAVEQVAGLDVLSHDVTGDTDGINRAIRTAAGMDDDAYDVAYDTTTDMRGHVDHDAWHRVVDSAMTLAVTSGIPGVGLTALISAPGALIVALSGKVPLAIVSSSRAALLMTAVALREADPDAVTDALLSPMLADLEV
jgi:hypothetical protein